MAREKKEVAQAVKPEEPMVEEVQEEVKPAVEKVEIPATAAENIKIETPSENVVETKELKPEPKTVPMPQQDAGDTGSRPEEVGKVEKSAEKVEVTKEIKSEPSGKYADLIRQIEQLSVADLADLVKELEERFGVSASAPVATATIGTTVGGATEESEEKSNYTVVLANSGDQKIAVIKAVREINQNLGLKEAKDLVDAAPKEIAKDVNKEEAEEAKKKLEAAGATVELK